MKSRDNFQVDLEIEKCIRHYDRRAGTQMIEGLQVGIDPRTWHKVSEIDPLWDIMPVRMSDLRRGFAERWLFTGTNFDFAVCVNSGIWLHEYWTFGPRTTLEMQSRPSFRSQSMVPAFGRTVQ